MKVHLVLAHHLFTFILKTAQQFKYNLSQNRHKAITLKDSRHENRYMYIL